jgi:hypothetical protein
MQFHPAEKRLKPLKHPLDPEVCQKAARYAVRVCEEMSKRSKILNVAHDDESGGLHQVAVFERDEILPCLGDMLGKGGFNSVYELERINLVDNTSKSSPQQRTGHALARIRVANSNQKLAVKVSRQKLAGACSCNSFTGRNDSAV